MPLFKPVKNFCPNIECEFEKSLKQGEKCPVCGAEAKPFGIREGAELYASKKASKKTAVESEKVAGKSEKGGYYCPNPMCTYVTELRQGEKCPVCNTEAQSDDNEGEQRSMGHGSFATAINCMDGRTQTPVTDYVRRKYKVDYVDMITEPGPIRVLAENKDKVVLESIRRRVEISTMKHGSSHIAIVGHHDCAGNPVGKETQLKQIIESIRTVRSWASEAEIIGLWIDEKWAAHEIR